MDIAKTVVIAAALLIPIGYFVLDQKPEHPVPIKITAQQLYDEYDKNELQADAKYRNKLLEVSGKVSSTGESFGEPFIVFDTGGLLTGVHADFGVKDFTKIASIQKSDMVTVVCIDIGMTLGSPFLNCRQSD